MSARVVCGSSGKQYVIHHHFGWWVVLDQATRDPLSGGFKSAAAAEAEARRLDALEGAFWKGRCVDCGDEWQEDRRPVVCPECHSYNAWGELPDA